MIIGKSAIPLLRRLVTAASKEAPEVIAEAVSKGHWVNRKWIKPVQVIEESTPKSRALINFTTKPTSSANSSLLERTPDLDIYVPTLTNEIQIAPKILPKSLNSGNSTIYTDYKSFDKFEPYFSEFTEEVHPIIMKPVRPPSKGNVIHVSNFDRPNGTIAASSTLNECLFTDKIRDCAAITIVDKTHNLQSLIHCFPGQSSKSNSEIIKYILSHSNPTDLEISIIPGIGEDTGKTISFLVNIVKQQAKGAKLNFLNFPRTKMGDSYGDVRAILLQNGEVGFCRNFEVGHKVVNPSEYITYCQIL